MDLRWGYDSNATLLKELDYCFKEATIIEEMLCAQLHMQVDVCFPRFGRGKHCNGLPVYCKNIIGFPQELAEVKQILSFCTNVRVADIVNVQPADERLALQRCRVVALLPTSFRVERPDGTHEVVPLERVQQRVVLPWKPSDLGDNFVILRRLDARREDYIEELRVRRNLSQRILYLFIHPEWTLAPRAWPRGSAHVLRGRGSAQRTRDHRSIS